MTNKTRTTLIESAIISAMLCTSVIGLKTVGYAHYKGGYRWGGALDSIGGLSWGRLFFYCGIIFLVVTVFNFLKKPSPNG
jgi:hypothetical protein